MSEYLGKVGAIIWKDILSELRTKDIVTSVLVFTVLVLVIFSFAFEPESEVIRLLSGGILWVAFTFAGMLGLSRSMAAETDKGSLQGLLLCPVDRDVIFMGKMAASLLFMLLVEAAAMPIFLILFNLPVFLPSLALVALMATIGFAAIGTIFATIAANTKAREIMLPILFIPVAVPVIIAAVKATGVIISGEPLSTARSWLLIIAAFDAIFLVLSAFLFEFAVEE
ncbi:MAG: cytochrome c-type biosis protein CcmB [Dehalococcoidia bacterium]|nr:cytochrome c-type biosis protein CcmB [Dehalococcoidia bacterium]